MKDNTNNIKPKKELTKTGNKKMTNKNKGNKKQKFSKRHPKATIAIRITLLLLLMAIVIGSGVVVGMLYGVWGQEFEISEEELAINGNSVVLDKDGKVIAELTGDENRKNITLEEMPQDLTEAYIAIEDERFNSHNGVDFKRTGAAIMSYIFHKGSSSFGGSTITHIEKMNMEKTKKKQRK